MTNDQLDQMMSSADFEEFWLEDENGSARVCEDVPAATQARVYDLEERTARFGEAVIRLTKRLPFNPVNNRLIDQMIGCGTSVGANDCEADDGYTPKDFRHKISLCRKEAKEAKYFLRMIATAEPSFKPDARLLWQEAKELHLIFCAILNTKHRPHS